MFQRPSVYIITLLCAGFSVCLNACAGLNTRLPDIASADLENEKQRQETQALQQFESDAGALLNVGWPVLTANADLCPKTRPSIGVKTHKAKSYPKALRKTAVRILGAEDEPRIFHIADGSPAAQAGFKRGDIILNDAGEPAKLRGESWEENIADNRIRVRRGNEVISFNVTPCLLYTSPSPRD